MNRWLNSTGTAVPDRELKEARAAGVDPENTGLAIMRTIRGYGVDTIFGIPGTHNLEFYRHLSRLGVRVITSRHEQGAGYAADAWAQRTGLPGVVLTTTGPGLLNALSAAGTAYCESRPMLILSPGAPRGQEGATIGTLHETKDQLAAAGAIVARAVRVNTAEAAVEAIHDAFSMFRSGRPRPVYVEVPLDLLEEGAELPATLIEPREPPHAAEVPREALADAAALLAAAKRPVILAGAGSRRGRAALLAIAERLGSPVVTSSNGKGVIRESHPLVVGAELRLAAAVEVLNEADVLLVVGSKIAHGEFAAAPLDPRGRVIRIDIDPGQRNANLESEVALIGDSGNILPLLFDELRDAEEPDASLATSVRASWADLDRIREHCLAETVVADVTLSEVAGRIAGTLPAGTILTGDSSQICYSGMMSRFRAEGPAECINMITYATLGYGLPAAIGAKAADPNRPVVCVTGDGALMFSIQELQTASEHQLDVTVICVDNGGYREIENNERDRGIEPIAVRLSQPDWPLAAQAFRARGFAVTDPRDLELRIFEALAHSGPALVHVPMSLFEAAERSRA